MSGTLTALALKFLPVILGVLFGAANDWLARRRAGQAERDVGRLTAERDAAIAGKQLGDRMATIAMRPPLSLEELAAELRRDAERKP